jgi:hypothetical protein
MVIWHRDPNRQPSTPQSHAYKKSSPHAILKSFSDDLTLLPISPRTVEAYLACVRHLGEFYHRSPELVTIEEVRQYFIHLKTHKKVARQTSTQALCAIKMFWEKTLRRPAARAGIVPFIAGWNGPPARSAGRPARQFIRAHDTRVDW